MYDTYSFGEWIKLRRQDLRRTQREIASSAFCSLAMIKKIEADERRPSRELAQALAVALEIPANQHDLFINLDILVISSGLHLYSLALHG